MLNDGNPYGHLTNDQLLLAKAEANHKATAGVAHFQPGQVNVYWREWKALETEEKRRDEERERIRIFDRPFYEREIVMRDWRKPRPMYV